MILYCVDVSYFLKSIITAINSLLTELHFVHRPFSSLRITLLLPHPQGPPLQLCAASAQILPVLLISLSRRLAVPTDAEAINTVVLQLKGDLLGEVGVGDAMCPRVLESKEVEGPLEPVAVDGGADRLAEEVSEACDVCGGRIGNGATGGARDGVEHHFEDASDDLECDARSRRGTLKKEACEGIGNRHRSATMRVSSCSALNSKKNPARAGGRGGFFFSHLGTPYQITG